MFHFTAKTLVKLLSFLQSGMVDYWPLLLLIWNSFFTEQPYIFLKHKSDLSLAPHHTHTHTLFTYLYLKTLSWLSTGFKMKKLSIHLTPACISKFMIFSRLQLHRSLFEYPKCLRTVCVSFYSFFTLLPELYLACCLAGGGGGGVLSFLSLNIILLSQ